MSNRKVLLEVDEAGSVYDSAGTFVGKLINNGFDYGDESVSSVTIQLLKQGLTTDDIIKLKNADLI